MNRALPRICVLLPLALAACAGKPGAYPSLAIRDAEKAAATAPASDATVLQPASPVPADMQARIGQLHDQAQRAHRDFQARSGSTERIVAAARGSLPPGDGWIEAQVALAGLQALRSDAVVALTELDRLLAEERLAHPEGDTPADRAITTARQDAEAWVEEENRMIARLAGRIAG